MRALGSNGEEQRKSRPWQVKLKRGDLKLYYYFHPRRIRSELTASMVFWRVCLFKVSFDRRTWFPEAPNQRGA